MSNLKIPEINLTSDSDDLFEDNWFTSPTTSFDGSSINSIPWAEDVVKQNQDEWERIERMFYGEEKLPTDEKLKNEIIEWTDRFSHLRVIGEQASIYFNINAVASDPNYEEIFSIHPPLFNCSKSARSQVPSLKAIERYYPVHETHTSIEDDVEKCLRITSGVLLTRRIPANSSQKINRIENCNKEISMEIPLSHIKKQNAALSNRDAIQSFCSRYADHRGAHQDCEPLHIQLKSLPYSARLLKIPAIKSNSFNTNTPVQNVIRISTATLVPIHRPLRPSLTLPSINIAPMYTDLASAGRSISALISHSPSTRVRLPSKSAFKKRSDSE